MSRYRLAPHCVAATCLSLKATSMSWVVARVEQALGLLAQLRILSHVLVKPSINGSWCQCGNCAALLKFKLEFGEDRVFLSRG